DFFIEASNATQVRYNFEHSTILYIPKVFTEISSKRVLVLEEVEGIRINDIENLKRAGHDLREIALKGGAAFFKMVFQDGFFHADPHPGNMFVLADGRLGFVDFGIMGRITEDNRDHFATVFLALANHDYDALVRQYVAMGFLSDESIDIDKFQREIKEDLTEFLEPYYIMQAKQIDFGAYVDRIISILRRYRLKLPANLYLMEKALITLEGILKQIDPEFNYYESAKPFVAELIGQKRNPLHTLKTARKNMADISDTLALLPKQIRMIFRKITQGEVRVNIHHEDLHHLIRDIDRSSNRLAFSVITAAIIIASSIIIHSGQGPMLFGLPVFGLIGYVLAAILGLWILIGILRSGLL
ncbi:MAG TPA: AarF/UbiB family protein, partial [Nitrospirota bacterium]|nr:AarF/UbiB family protein [Nitrospirota bacterium]